MAVRCRRDSLDGGTVAVGFFCVAVRRRWDSFVAGYARSPSTAPLQRPFAGPPAVGTCVRVHHTYTETYEFAHAHSSRQQHKHACKPARMGINGYTSTSLTYHLQWTQNYKTNLTLGKQPLMNMYMRLVLLFLLGEL